MQKPRSVLGGVFARAPIADTTLDEHDRVRLRETFSSENGVVPKGSVGTIVGVWKKGELYEVEFLAPVQAVLTIPAMALARNDDSP